MSGEEEADDDDDDVGEAEAEAVGIPTVVKFEGQEAALGKSPEPDDGEYEQLVPPNKTSGDTSEDS